MDFFKNLISMFENNQDSNLDITDLDSYLLDHDAGPLIAAVQCKGNMCNC